MKIIHYVLAVAIFSIFIIPATAQTNEVPSWIKNTAGWWADDQISDKEFLEAMGFLVRTGAINPYKDESNPTEIELEKIRQENEELKRQLDLLKNTEQEGDGWVKLSKDASADWMNNAITDSEYFVRIQSVVTDYSIDIPQPTKSCGVNSDRLPMWMKDNARTWVNDDNNADFMQLLSCLKEFGHIK